MTAAMKCVLGIDPGPTESAYTVIDQATRRPMYFDKVPNEELLDALPDLMVVGELGPESVAVEMVASYGMPVGAEVFETCVWVGRFDERCRSYFPASYPGLGDAPYPRHVYRSTVKVHHCHTMKANDANITQALIDRFAPSTPNKGKGTKDRPGWFYGFKADIWQAYALAVLIVDQLCTETP